VYYVVRWTAVNDAGYEQERPLLIARKHGLRTDKQTCSDQRTGTSVTARHQTPQSDDKSIDTMIYSYVIKSLRQS
jgi:hypothetical protein